MMRNKHRRMGYDYVEIRKINYRIHEKKILETENDLRQAAEYFE